MTLGMTLAKADRTLAGQVAKLQAAQEAYFNAQVDTDESGQAILRRKYQRRNKVKVKGVTLEVREYDGALGKGWLLDAQVTVGGIRYHRQMDFGPEGRTKDWEKVNE